MKLTPEHEAEIEKNLDLLMENIEKAFDASHLGHLKTKSIGIAPKTWSISKETGINSVDATTSFVTPNDCIYRYNPITQSVDCT